MAVDRSEQGIGFGDLEPYVPGSAPRLFLGVDLGSKTVKVVVQDAEGTIRYCSYRYHLSNVRKTLVYSLELAMEACPDEPMVVGITGSAGMALADVLDLPFIQEVVACRAALHRLLPEADVAIEIGGEDSKILYVSDGEELRMNATCAGGTGGFINTIAGMVDSSAEELNFYAHGCNTIYPIASRCAVFAQMDVRPLINEGISKEDIAGSVFDAVAVQCISGLACGRPIRGKVALLGGPMHFLSSLRHRFQVRLGLDDEDVLVPEDGHLFVAQGAAFYAQERSFEAHRLADLIAKVETLDWSADDPLNRLEPLFTSKEELEEFRQIHNNCKAPRKDISSYAGRAFLGIDSGSEAVKYTLIAEDGSVLHTAYERSAGNLIDVAKELLIKLYKRMPRLHDGSPAITIAHTTVTGYGEQYLREAFAADSGEVETVSHVRAAQELLPDVDFILDIGGQDIKCVWLQDGQVSDVILNEACSSGCGALVSGMAWSLYEHLDEFIEAGVMAEEPVDLGTRCTVFMTSRVRHAQKVGATVGDLSAGLAYAVVRNAIHKVIRVSNPNDLGKNIMVQGGTFANDAVLRAFEKTYNCEVNRPDISPFMGAYGAALLARERGATQEKSTFLDRSALEKLTFGQKTMVCDKCNNACHLVITRFDEDGKKRNFVVGNRCSRGAEIEGEGIEVHEELVEDANLPNMYARRNELLFDREGLNPKEASRGAMGIMRSLDIYETYPFWHRFFTDLGFAVRLSSGKLRGRSLETIPSESLCYPAKLAHGQLFDLLNKKVPYIWAPYVDGISAPGAACPVIAEYPLVLSKAVEGADESQSSLLSPVIPSIYKDGAINPDLGAIVYEALKAIDNTITQDEINAALISADQAFRDYSQQLQQENLQAYEKAKAAGADLVILAGRPYHGDPAVHHGIPELLNRCGYGVFTEDLALAAMDGKEIEATFVWEFPQRVITAANYVLENDDLDFVELSSFGCGLDAATSDEVRAVLRQRQKVPTFLKIDEMNDLASARIRIRSMHAARHGILGKGPKSC